MNWRNGDLLDGAAWVVFALIVFAVIFLVLKGKASFDKAVAVCSLEPEITNGTTCSLEPEITNGTTVLLFPEWKNSSSAFERVIYTNYFGVYSNKAWYTRELQTDGTLIPFWVNDEGDKTIEEAKQDFRINLNFAVYRIMYDSMAK